MLLSQGSVTIFWSNGLVGFIMTLGLVLLFWPVISWVIAKVRVSKPA
jgi:putative tricarboxylic transport membrane protein